jgi:hypothetical protein
VPQLPTREEYEAIKLLQRQMREQSGVAPVAIANGGTIIADAYSE